MEREVEVTERDVTRPAVDERGPSPREIAPGLAYVRDRIVNVYFVGNPGAGDGAWTLVDAGLAGSAERLAAAAGARFGRGARPSAVVLTHGHFDHVGALRALAERWDVPVYAHELELPYLTGRSSYPPPDPAVGGGAFAALSRLYSRGPIDLGDRVRTLPADGAVPGMPDWRWIHTPGHSPGHVSFFRDADRTLIAGDAFVTTKQESALAVIAQRQEVHGPPAYFTPDWAAARESVERLAALEPSLAATGHGVPMSGVRMLQDLQELADHFDELAVPKRGRYVRQPAVMNADGVVSVPPPVADPLARVVVGAAVVGAVGLAAATLRNRRR
jgi:glyoxylase-like metal-dependent hydrolase (beta-lactamase superfamily II)